MINQILFLYNFNKQNINKVYFKNSIKYIIHGFYKYLLINMNINYEIEYMNKDNKIIRLKTKNIDEGKNIYKTLMMDDNIKNVKFYIVNNTKLEMKYDELFKN